MEHLVRTIRRNSDKEVTSIEIATLREYTTQLGQDLQRVISDVESMIYEWIGLPREHWDDETWTAFTAIRHKLLDKAGEITRLPENLISPERSPAPFEQA